MDFLRSQGLPVPRTDSRGIPYKAQLLGRLRTCRAAGLQASPELLDQVIAVLASGVTLREQLRDRDKLIRRAGLLLPEMSDNARAAALALAARAIPRIRTSRLGGARGLPLPAATVRECLQEAATYGRLPGGRRQFLRILLASPSGE